MGIVKGMTITLIADGSDEEEALNGLCNFLSSELAD
jgi:phosphotransferase system HPr-like phosphotransfer protein